MIGLRDLEADSHLGLDPRCTTRGLAATAALLRPYPRQAVTSPSAQWIEPRTAHRVVRTTCDQAKFGWVLFQAKTIFVLGEGYGQNPEIWLGSAICIEIDLAGLLQVPHETLHRIDACHDARADCLAGCFCVMQSTSKMNGGRRMQITDPSFLDGHRHPSLHRER
jgi:hypothetical protein